MDQFVSIIFDKFLYPKVCVGCDRVGKYLCTDCVSTIEQTDLVCPECERPSIGGRTHPLCHRRWGIDGLWSLGIYQNPLKKAIQKLKYRYVRGMVEEMVNIVLEYWAKYQPLLLEEIKKDGGVGWVIVPVPLHPKRENWRGFNQSALLGEMLAQKNGSGIRRTPQKNQRNQTPSSSTERFQKIQH